VGLRALSAPSEKTKTKSQKSGGAAFKQYREKDGQFYFKLVDAQGAVLVQSLAYATPQLAGQDIAQLREGGLPALSTLSARVEPVAVPLHAAITYALTEINA
jgi:tryptophanyl-tRNA synthetase